MPGYLPGPPPIGPAFDSLWDELAAIGRARSGGYHRYAWSAAERECREWFLAGAAARGLDCEQDRNGNLWAWWATGEPGPAVVTGSHLDSVPDGGAYDGPLGVATALAAVDLLRHRGLTPARPLAVVAFSDEEGARFGVPCIGSRLLTGALAPARVVALRDEAGQTLGEAMRRAGADPEQLGPDPARLRRVGVFVELHVEQGRQLDGTGRAIGVGDLIWPHGRWRLDVRGATDHAGTTATADRRDPMPAVAAAILAAQRGAAQRDARATVGRLRLHPGATNAIVGRASAWLDARGADAETVRALVAEVAAAARGQAVTDGVSIELNQESWSPPVRFAEPLGARIGALLGDPPRLATAAGHDAGILAAAGVPTAMLYVRNPTGVSHAPAEHAEREDCHAGVLALADVLADLLTGPEVSPAVIE